MKSVYENTNENTNLVGTRELARILGVSPPAVTKAYTEGRITPSGYDKNNFPLYDPILVPREWTANTKKHSTTVAAQNLATAARIAERIGPTNPLPVKEPVDAAMEIYKNFTSPRPQRPSILDGEKDNVTFEEVDGVLAYLEGCVNTRRADHKKWLEQECPNNGLNFENVFPPGHDLLKQRVIDLTRAAMKKESPQAVLSAMLEVYQAIGGCIVSSAPWEAVDSLMDINRLENYL